MSKINGHVFVVEGDVPLPETRGSKPLFPLEEMKVADSFAVPAGMLHQVRNAVCAHGRRHGKTFSVRKHADAYRCWRVS